MTERTKPAVKNYKIRYCGYLVEIIEFKEFINDPERGRLVRVQIRYEDGFEIGALLKEDEIESSSV